MRHLAVFFAIATAVSAIEQEIYRPTPEIMDIIYNHAKPCAIEHNIEMSVVPRLTDGTIPRDDATNKFLYCFALRGGYITEDGHMEVDKVASLLKGHPLEEKYKAALHKCNEVTKENPIATVVEMNRCSITELPLRLDFSKY